MIRTSGWIVSKMPQKPTITAKEKLWLGMTVQFPDGTRGQVWSMGPKRGELAVVVWSPAAGCNVLEVCHEAQVVKVASIYKQAQLEPAL